MSIDKKPKPSKDKNFKLKERKPLSEITPWYIWETQVKHFLLNNCVRWAAAWAIAYSFVYAWRWYGSLYLDDTIACLSEDV